MFRIVFTLAVLGLSGCQLLDALPAPPAAAPAVPAAAAGTDLPPMQPLRSSRPLSDYSVPEQLFAAETKDHGTVPFSSLIPTNYTAHTPVLLPGAERLRTYELHRLLTAEDPPPLVNVQPAGPAGAELIGNAVWLSGAGKFGRMDDATQTRLAKHLETLTKGQKKQPLVFYCTGSDCWHAYNAGTRAIALGYRKVGWYRGGLRAWYAAGLPTVASDDDRW